MLKQDRYVEFFCPPLWRQRRIFIKDTLTRFNIKTVLDYGCGEAAVLSYLIPENDNPIIKMAGIDICDDSLTEAIDRCTPWQTDYNQLRNFPLVIDIFKGSIGVPDDRLFGYQAIICTEVIEHVFPNVLDSFLDITLGIYQPEILIVTTPNCEYNVNFPDLKYGTEQSVFRHDDHKFEWTRKEFNTWCNNGANKYGYNVEYHGIGLLHGKYNELNNGHCTQACIFIKNSPSTKQLQTFGNSHKLLKHIEFPYFNEPIPSNEKIIEELKHFIKVLCISEMYIQQQDEKKKLNLYHENDNINIDSVMDWRTFNIEEVIPTTTTTNVITPKKQEIIPIHLPISNLWNILRIRQICVTMETMIQFLSLLDKDKYELLNNNSMIQVKSSLIEFDLLLNNDTRSVSSFSSHESW